ncbi:hypothetical protein Ahy_B07g086824 [Arachis hypogaea]|uniref:Protein FAR1-RELATED SEQUENCE n=1 Tax=Arachis hypogaea TaxID=3818 RepID=A0A444YAJ8_ARAHY|nr:hypothetical protein Ahy_B07g086824 [Arachis hypogaea]
MLKQHRDLTMFVRRTIENNEEAKIRPSKTYQSFVTVAGGHRELNFIEKDVRIYITRDVQNISEQDDAKEFGKYLLRMKEKNQNFFFELNLESKFDVANFHTVISCATKSPIETPFQHMYTYEKFREVQAQFRGKVNCITRSRHFTLGFTAYEVVEQVSNSTFNKFVVTYDAISCKVKCQCLLFESRDILCRHSLSALSFERVDKVAPKNILERWSKNVKRKHTDIKSRQDEPLLEPRRADWNFALGFFYNVMTEIQEYQTKSKSKGSLSHEDATLNDVNDLQRPHVLEQEDVLRKD